MTNTTDKSILTAAGKALLAQLNAEEKPLVIDKMIFANVPNRPEFPQPDDVVPSDDVVHEAAIEQRGRLSVDSVIYSTTLTSQEGPFEFNWTGAYCSEYSVLVTIDHHALTPKTVDEPGVSGNTLVRSVVLEYKDIAEITNITVDASSWQYNATPRMKKMDDDVAQAIIDQNGKDWFIEGGFLVTPQASAFNIKAGAGYVSGNRVTLEFDRNVQVPNKPSFIYVDAHREGTPTGEQVTLFDFVVTAEEKDDYTDGNGVKHFVCKIAQVLADGSVSDFRKEQKAASRNWVLEQFAKHANKVHHITSDDYPSTVDVQAYIDNNVSDADMLLLSGEFTASKLTGLHTDIYGEDNRDREGIPQHGGQPCLMLPNSRKNLIYDASRAKFIVDKHGQGGLDVWGRRATIVHGGHWIAPGHQSAAVRFPPIDGNFGFAEKGGYVKGAYYGFNTTTLTPDIGGARNNMYDTSLQASGGYNGAFPQDNGTTSDKWGQWLGGYIGNYGSAINICGGFGHKVLDFEAEGFNGYGIEVGLLNKPDGTPLGRIDVNAAPYVPKKTKILGGYIHDCYIGGIQRNRYIKCDIQHVDIERTGHPDASLANTINGVSPQVDPGYGVSSGRASPQNYSTVSYCSFEDCKRKGIDAHMGTNEKYIENNIKAMTWGIQIAIDEALQDTSLGTGFEHRKYNLIIRDNTIYAGYRAIDAMNGAFGRGAGDGREAIGKWWSNIHAIITDNKCFAPNGWCYNYGHSPFTIHRNTFTFAAPYGYENIGDGFGFTHGALGQGSNKDRGPVDLDSICTNRVFNSPDGNFRYAYYLYGIRNSVFRDNAADVTPYQYDATDPDGPYKSGNPNIHRDNLASYGFVQASGTSIDDSKFDNNKSINQLTGIVTEWKPADTDQKKAQTTQYEMKLHGTASVADTGYNKTDRGTENGYIVVTLGGLPDPANTWGREGNIDYCQTTVVPAGTVGQYLSAPISVDDINSSTIRIWAKVESFGNNVVGHICAVSSPYEDDDLENGGLALLPHSDGFKLAPTGGGVRFVDGNPYVADTKLNFNEWYQFILVREINSSLMAFGAQGNGNNSMNAKFAEIRVMKNLGFSSEEANNLFELERGKYSK
ncbi:phage tail protein [Vibrio splendidus]|uniref:phage tail-collar fiber domain-containing protein n=1 Tax=Vibrio splendidus TaxID=29497 RepID=UPI000CC2BE4E|nr:phage tail protein [Vibrio splendidus]PMK41468.1 hypothetical protein BCU01_14880 [Vibrio splendidus]